MIFYVKKFNENMKERCVKFVIKSELVSNHRNANRADFSVAVAVL